MHGRDSAITSACFSDSSGTQLKVVGTVRGMSGQLYPALALWQWDPLCCEHPVFQKKLAIQGFLQIFIVLKLVPMFEQNFMPEFCSSYVTSSMQPLSTIFPRSSTSGTIVSHKVKRAALIGNAVQRAGL